MDVKEDYLLDNIKSLFIRQEDNYKAIFPEKFSISLNYKGESDYIEQFNYTLAIPKGIVERNCNQFNNPIFNLNGYSTKLTLKELLALLKDIDYTSHYKFNFYIEKLIIKPPKVSVKSNLVSYNLQTLNLYITCENNYIYISKNCEYMEEDVYIISIKLTYNKNNKNALLKFLHLFNSAVTDNTIENYLLVDITKCFINMNSIKKEYLKIRHLFINVREIEEFDVVLSFNHSINI